MADEGYWYSGRMDGTVWVTDRDQQRRLEHHVRHSPDGFAWGYGGSGPADLARSILIDALGDEGKCSTCDGTGQIVYCDGQEMSIQRAEADCDDNGWVKNVYGCNHCEDGCLVVPAAYQAFKFDIIAQIPSDDPWALSKNEVLEWYRQWEKAQ